MTSNSSASGAPLVGVIMGSSSDWEVMKHAVAMLQDFGVAHEARVISAHRMPQDMAEYGAAARARGLRAIIAGAGGAAHLPGMMAALTEVPVFGVPVPSRYLRGEDSLLSIVQMPKGVPVATLPSARPARPTRRCMPSPRWPPPTTPCTPGWSRSARGRPMRRAP